MRWLTWEITQQGSTPDEATKEAWRTRVAEMRVRHGDVWADLLRAAVRQQRRFAKGGAPKHRLFAEPMGAWTFKDLVELDHAPADLSAFIAERYPEPLRGRVEDLGLPFLQAVMLIGMCKPALALEPLLHLSDGPLIWLERARVARTLGYTRSVEAALASCAALVEPPVYQALVATASGAQEGPAG